MPPPLQQHSEDRLSERNQRDSLPVGLFHASWSLEGKNEKSRTRNWMTMVLDAEKGAARPFGMVGFMVGRVLSHHESLENECVHGVCR